MKLTQISISGLAGTGTSTVMRGLVKMLPGYTGYSSGGLFRQLADAKRMPHHEFETYVANNPEVDLQIDNEIAKLQQVPHIIVESRRGYYDLPHAFKVYLECGDGFDRFRRIAVREKISVNEAQAKTLERERILEARLKKIYGKGMATRSSASFDVIINTSVYSEGQTMQRIARIYHTWLKVTVRQEALA